MIWTMLWRVRGIYCCDDRRDKREKVIEETEKFGIYAKTGGYS